MKCCEYFTEDAALGIVIPCESESTWVFVYTSTEFTPASTDSYESCETHVAHFAREVREFLSNSRGIVTVLCTPDLLSTEKTECVLRIERN